MVLAAGRGERMRPLSSVLPKPALPLPDKPVIASPLALAASCGTDTVVVNTWHLAAAMEERIAELGDEPEVVFSREPELMGTAGGLALARDRGLLGDDGPVLVVNGDGRLNLDLEPLVDRMSSAGDLVTLALLPHLDPRRWSRVCLDRHGAVSAIRRPGPPEPDEVPLLFPGVMLVAREALDRIAVEPGGTPEHLWRPALDEGRFGGVVVAGHWREIGTPADYLAAVLDRLGDAVDVHPSAKVHASARLRSSLVGRGVRIDAGARITDSIIAEGAVVEADAQIHRAILMGREVAGQSSELVDEVRARAHSPAAR